MCNTSNDKKLLIILLYRYLVRSVIVPFKFQASQVELRTFDQLIQRASSAFPKLLSIGNWLEGIDNDTVHGFSERIREVVDGHMDSRLATQYALTIMCVQKVCYMLSLSCLPNNHILFLSLLPFPNSLKHPKKLCGSILLK